MFFTLRFVFAVYTFGFYGLLVILLAFYFMCIHLLVGKYEGKIPLERRRRTWEDNIKMHI